VHHPHVEKHQCAHIADFKQFAHINAWTRYDEPINYAEPVVGDRMRELVFQKLQDEAQKMNWDPSIDGFADVVYAVCPLYEVEFEGELEKTAAWYAIEGIRDFLFSQAQSLFSSKNAKFIIADIRGSSAAARAAESASESQWMTSQTEERLKDQWISSGVKKASSAASRALDLQRLANKIADTAERFVVRTDLQGFIVHHNNRQMVAEFAACPDDLFYRRNPQDLGEWKYGTVLSLEICKWSICSDEGAALLQQQGLIAKQRSGDSGVSLSQEARRAADEDSMRQISRTVSQVNARHAESMSSRPTSQRSGADNMKERTSRAASSDRLSVMSRSRQSTGNLSPKQKRPTVPPVSTPLPVEERAANAAREAREAWLREDGRYGKARDRELSD
jgi:hypothetical protein